MGWGVLTGLGQGLSGYAEIMGEKRKENFQLKREELAFERNKSLKDLEFQNQNKRDEKTRGWQKEDIELKRKYQLEDRDWEREKYEQGKADEMTAYEAKREIDNRYQQEQLKMSYEFQKLKTQEDRDAKAEELTAVLSEDGELDFRDKLIVASAKTGQDLSSIYGKGKKSVSPEVIETVANVFMANDDLSKLLSENPQKGLQMVGQIAYQVQHGSSETGGSGGKNPIMGMFEALSSGEETPESLLQQATSEPERQAAQMAIDAWEKEGGGEEDKPEVETPSAPVERTPEGVPVTGRRFGETFKGWLKKSEDIPYPNQ